MSSLDNILNANRPVRRLLAAIVPASGILFLGALVWFAIVLMEERSGSVTEKQRELGRLNAILALKPMIENAEDIDLADGQLPEFLQGESDAVIQADLQTRLAAIAKAADAIIVSAGPTPVTDRSGTRMTGLRANIAGSNNAIVQVVAAIESAKPYLTIRSALINSIDDKAADTGAKPRQLILVVQFEGALPPNGQFPSVGGNVK